MVVETSIKFHSKSKSARMHVLVDHKYAITSSQREEEAERSIIIGNKMLEIMKITLRTGRVLIRSKTDSYRTFLSSVPRCPTLAYSKTLITNP